MRQYQPLAKHDELQELLGPYTKQLKYYRTWANRHRYAYWVLALLSVTCAITLAFAMLFKADTLHIAVIAIALNSLLLMNQAIRSDTKYPRYRMTEIKIEFALQAFRNKISQIADEEKPIYEVALQNLDEFHRKIESLVLEEYTDFVGDMKTIDDIHAASRHAPKK